MCGLCFSKQKKCNECKKVHKFKNKKQTKKMKKKGIEYLSKEVPVVVLDWNDMQNNKNLTKSVQAAYDSNGFGILLVKNVPTLKEKREKVLKMARVLALSEESILKDIEHPQSLYSVGWSHGREKLAQNMPDFSKGKHIEICVLFFIFIYFCFFFCDKNKCVAVANIGRGKKKTALKFLFFF